MNARSLPWLLLCCLSCEPELGKDPKYVHGSIANQCVTRYAAPQGQPLNTIELVVEDHLPADFVLEAICVQLDGGAVLLTNASELTKTQQAIRRIPVTTQGHTLLLKALWRRSPDGFDVRTSHEIDGHATKVQVTAYDSGADELPNRPKVRWQTAP